MSRSQASSFRHIIESNRRLAASRLHDLEITGQRVFLERFAGSANPDPKSACWLSAYDIAIDYAAIGETDRERDWLERACGDEESDLVDLRVDPRLDSLREAPGFRTFENR